MVVPPHRGLSLMAAPTLAPVTPSEPQFWHPFFIKEFCLQSRGEGLEIQNARKLYQYWTSNHKHFYSASKKEMWLSQAVRNSRLVIFSVPWPLGFLNKAFPVYTKHYKVLNKNVYLIHSFVKHHPKNLIGMLANNRGKHYSDHQKDAYLLHGCGYMCSMNIVHVQGIQQL